MCLFPTDLDKNRLAGSFVSRFGRISTTQINDWYVRGKHFDFWQATTEQGKPGYFTTVRRRRFPSREGKREGKRRALLDGKPLL